jgi:L-ascorbate metabolism protein UlaG (beta-lactamase superfamily)
MEITYLGHSSFKLKGKNGTVITDPYEDYVGFALPSLSADVVTISHDHKDHNAAHKVKGTARREKPFIVSAVGEYEVGGISVFGVQTYHDASGGVERGVNNIFTILLDDVKVCHLGDLGHELTTDQLNQIGAVDVVLCPVGGVFTIDPKTAVKTIHSLEPGYAVPMHYRTDGHADQVFGDLSPLDEFLQAYGAEVKPMDQLNVDKTRLPEETELVVLTK